MSAKWLDCIQVVLDTLEVHLLMLAFFLGTLEGVPCEVYPNSPEVYPNGTVGNDMLTMMAHNLEIVVLHWSLFVNLVS